MEDSSQATNPHQLHIHVNESNITMRLPFKGWFRLCFEDPEGQWRTGVAQYESISQLDWSLPHGDGAADVHRETAEFVERQFEDHGQRVGRYVRSLGVPWADVEDVLQEVFLALHRHLLFGGPRTHLRGWVFRVAHNLGLKHLRKEQRLRTRAIESQYVLLPCSDGDPEELFLRSRRQQRLMAIFDTLPSEDRHCLFLRFEGLRYREIAGVLGISLGSVANSLARSLQRLEQADEG